jgi:hypothetical protein
MSRKWALLVDNIIGNVIVCDDEDFIANHPDWKNLQRMDVTDYDPQPGIMWILEGNKFLAPDTVKPLLEEHRNAESNYEIEVIN